MDIKEIISKKANGKNLSENEICFFVSEYTNGNMPDYQAAALLMAIKINGMSDEEVFALTKAMLYSGEIIDLSGLGFCVDKHSTGGISDTTTLALAPICAACGVHMLKLSGRGLGFTGGTIDKLESFENFNTELDMETAKKLVAKNGACVVSATQNLATADKKLYALRDVTSTVESLPLIASSIMSKKLASGADAIVLDVKFGNGAFMKTKSDAKKLAELMVKIGKAFGKKMDYVLDDMNEPLGFCIGNKLEAYEAIEVLKGKKGKLREATLTLAAKSMAPALNLPFAECKKLAINSIDNGEALKKFKQMVKAQGGSLNLFKGLGLKPSFSIYSDQSGVLKYIDCEKLGLIVGQMGAARTKIGQEINYNVGVKTFHKLKDKIKKGDKLFDVYAPLGCNANELKDQILKTYSIR